MNFNGSIPDDRTHLGEILDSNIKIKTGKQFEAFCSSTLSENVDDISTYENKKILSISEIKELWKKFHGIESLREVDQPNKRKVYLHELLADSEILLPTVELPKRNPELEKRIVRLKHEQAEKEYQRMTQNVNFTSRFKPEDSIGLQLKQMNSGLIGVIQLVISLAAAFMFGYMGIEVFVGYTFDLAVRLLLGIMCALIVGAAELYFLAINIAMAEDSPPVNNNKKTN